MLMNQFCTLVVEQAITFLDNLATLDSPGSGTSTKEIFERKSRILPNSIIGRHLKYHSYLGTRLNEDILKDG